MFVSSDNTATSSNANKTASGRNNAMSPNKTRVVAKEKSSKNLSSTEQNPSATAAAFGSQSRASKEGLT
jgi:hypothetical protein